MEPPTGRFVWADWWELHCNIPCRFWGQMNIFSHEMWGYQKCRESKSTRQLGCTVGVVCVGVKASGIDYLNAGSSVVKFSLLRGHLCLDLGLGTNNLLNAGEVIWLVRWVSFLFLEKVHPWFLLCACFWIHLLLKHFFKVVQHTSTCDLALWRVDRHNLRCMKY